MKSSHFNIRRFTTLLVCGAFLIALNIHGANPLIFNDPVQSTNGNYTGLGAYYSGTTMDFLNVGTVNGSAIDMRVTVASPVGPYSYIGLMPNVTLGSTIAGDLGFLHQANSAGTGGVDYTMTFYQGGGIFAQTVVVPQLHWIINDVDGETHQTESVTAFNADGLQSYQVGNAGNHVTAATSASSVSFTGPGANTNENDPTGAFVLTYANTSAVTLSFRSTTGGSTFPNAVYTGLDGDLSSNPTLTGFGPPVTVPEPSGAFLIAIVGLSLLRRRRA